MKSPLRKGDRVLRRRLPENQPPENIGGLGAIKGVVPNGTSFGRNNPPTPFNKGESKRSYLIRGN